MKKTIMKSETKKLSAMLLVFAIVLYSPTFMSMGNILAKEKKKSYLVSVDTESQIRSIKKNYKVSSQTNDNSEKMMEDTGLWQ